MTKSLSTHLGLLTIVFLTIQTKGVRAVYHGANPNDFDTMNAEPNLFRNAPRRLTLEDIPKMTGLINAIDKESIHPKLGSELTKLLDKSKISRGGKNDKILLDIAFTSPIDNVVAKEMFASIVGVNVVNCFGPTCSVYAEVGHLAEIAEIDQVKFLRQPKIKTNTGKVTSEGVQAMYADVASAKYSINGTGLLIGVMSTSFDCRGGAENDTLSGDLPHDNIILSELTSEECSFYGNDEGRAMMQLIHDVAPGARMAFRTAVRGGADFAAGILELANIGCDIIVDDIGYLDESFFQDSIIAQAIDQVVAEGVAYFSAAGNDARTSWEEPNGFRPVTVNGTKYHQFGTDSNGEPILLQRVAMQNFYSIFTLQWDEPFYSISGAPGSASDIDIHLFYNGTIVASGIDDNILSGDPLEIFVLDPYDFTRDDIVYIDMAIVIKAGPLPKYMKMILFGEATFEFDDGSPTVFGHSNAALAAAVGASYYLETPAFGVFPPLIESYSSAGGLPILFAKNGTRLFSPEIRKQPRFTGPDGGITTFFGFENRFFGTSAAAPHVAAVAALLLEAKGGPKSLTPLELYSIMEETAIDMDDPFTPAFDTGFDFGTGHGLVNTVAALDKLCTITWNLYNSRTDKLVQEFV
jgi:subtilisin family serine protease